MYVKISELSYLYAILNDINRVDYSKGIEISCNPMKDSLLISLNYEDYVRLNDVGAFSFLISL